MNLYESISKSNKKPKLQEEVSFDEIESKMSNAESYDDLYNAVDLIEDIEIRSKAKAMLNTCERDGDSVDEAYSVTTTEYIDPYRMDGTPNIQMESEKEQTYIIKQTAGNFGTYKICEWKSTSPEKAVEEFTTENPDFKDGKKGHITATLKESDDKKCVLCGKHFSGWGNDAWPLADGYCCDDCNMNKVVPARIAQAYKKEEPKDKKEAEYGNGTRQYSNALIDLCEQGIVSWENVAHGLINFCSEDDIKDFCDSYQYTELIDNTTGNTSFEDSESLKESGTLDKIKQYPDYVRENLANKKDSTLWHCQACNSFFKEPKSEKTDMENHNGVGTDFPDHHYENILYCPNCNSDEVEEEHIFFDSIVDDFINDSDLYEILYNKMSERRPELFNSDTYLEDVIDEPELEDIIAELIP